MNQFYYVYYKMLSLKNTSKRKGLLQSYPLNSSETIELFLSYSNDKNNKQKNDYVYLFDKLNNLDEILDKCGVFLELKAALQYSQFIKSEQIILHLFVPQFAIEGHTHGLAIKKGFIDKHYIHGYFPGNGNGLLYIKNPHFDMDHYPAEFHQQKNLQAFMGEYA